MFDNIKPMLELCENARKGFKETIDEINEITEIEILKDPSFLESMRVFFWAISANYDGDIKKSGIQILHDKPFITINTSGCWWDVNQINYNLVEFIRTALDMPEQVYETVKSLIDLAQNITCNF